MVEITKARAEEYITYLKLVEGYDFSVVDICPDTGFYTIYGQPEKRWRNC
jgi:hypothetical protein